MNILLQKGACIWGAGDLLKTVNKKGGEESMCTEHSL
jgi:hypothetical protein